MRIRSVFAALLITCAGTGVSLAQDSGPPRVIEGPIWQDFARPPQTNRFLPREAEQRGVGGSARLRCYARADGTVHNCTVEDESTRGLGLGRAALGITDLYKLRPRDRTGQPVEGGVVEFSVVFQCSGTCDNWRGRAGPEGGGRGAAMRNRPG